MKTNSKGIATQCEHCLAHNDRGLEDHICPPWLKALVATWREQHPGKDPSDEIIVEEQVKTLLS